MEIKKELIKKYLEFEGFDYFTASVENYYQTGKPSGSLVIALCKMMEEYHESELKKLRVADVSGSVCYCGKPSVEECEPCCSLACALKPKMYR
jgi:hypothetical protein